MGEYDDEEGWGGRVVLIPWRTIRGWLSYLGAKVQKMATRAKQADDDTEGQVLVPQREEGGEGGKALVLSPWVWSGPASSGCSLGEKLPMYPVGPSVPSFPS